jgi:L-threonylcarbamoyladenylate synthase
MERRKPAGWEDDIKECVRVLRQGGTILYPTDTVWGIGCDATSPDAVKKIYGIKRREESKSLITLADSIGMVERYVKVFPDAARNILEVTDKPVTIVYPACRYISPNALADDGSAGIRVTDDPFCLDLLGAFRKPVISTSANISGAPAPEAYSDISEEIIKAVDYVVRYRQNDREKRTPSPVIKINPDNSFVIIRR